MVMRTTLGATRRSAAQHSQSLHARVEPRAGIESCLPSTPYAAKGLLKICDSDEKLVIFEDKMMNKLKGPGPAEDYTIPSASLMEAARRRHYSVAVSSMVQVALGARVLEKEGISAEVVAPARMAA